MSAQRLTERALTALEPGATLWDREVRGLGARRRADDGRVVFVFKYRSAVERDATGRGRQRYVTIGPWGRGDWGIEIASVKVVGIRCELWWPSVKRPGMESGQEETGTRSRPR
jgi:hypothetical protein